MTRVLVTGAAGFIGSHLLPLLEGEGFEVLGIDAEAGDILKEETWTALPPMDAVVHLAGSAFVPDSWKRPPAFIHCNAVGTALALEFCRRHQARLVFPSSYLYGNPASLPIPETAPFVVPNPYALSKKMAEDICRFYAESLGVPVVVLRPFNVFGPGQSDLFIIPSIIRQAMEGKEIRVMDLEPRRDYVYVQDLVRAVHAALCTSVPYCVCNIGSGESHSVAQVIDIIQDILGTRLPVQSEGNRRKEEIMDTVADIAEARRLFGWAPTWSFRDAMAATIDRMGGRGRSGAGAEDRRLS